MVRQPELAMVRQLGLAVVELLELVIMEEQLKQGVLGEL